MPTLGIYTTKCPLVLIQYFGGSPDPRGWHPGSMQAIILTGRRSCAWLTRPVSSVDSLAATALRMVFKATEWKGEKRHLRVRNMIFLGLFYSGPQSLIQGGHRVITLKVHTKRPQSGLEACCHWGLFHWRARCASPASPQPPRGGSGCQAPTSGLFSSPPALPSGRSERRKLKCGLLRCLLVISNITSLSSRYRSVSSSPVNSLICTKKSRKWSCKKTWNLYSLLLNNIAYLKTRYILVQIEKTRDCDLDLVVGEVRESGLQEICNKTLEKVESNIYMEIIWQQ